MLSFRVGCLVLTVDLYEPADWTINRLVMSAFVLTRKRVVSQQIWTRHPMHLLPIFLLG